MPYPYWEDEPEPEDEVSFLKEQAEAIKAELKEIEKRLAELGKEAQNE
jgi:exo-beta-1,3-glucanase (GH17 family)